MYHDKGHHAAWSTDASNNGNNGRSLVAIGNEIDQDFLVDRENIREDSF
jgi:hypothetical protein